MIQRKANSKEKKPPAIMATIKDTDGNDLDFILNSTRKHFEYDVVTIRHCGKEFHIVRDHLVEILLNADKVSDKELS